MFCRFPCIVRLKHINNSHEVYFGAFFASHHLVHEKASAYGEEGRDLFVRKGWWLGSERAAAQYTSHLLSYLTTDWIPRSLHRGKNTVDLEEEMSFWGLAACPSPLLVFLPSAALHFMTAAVTDTASSSLSTPAKMWNGVEYRVC